MTNAAKNASRTFRRRGQIDTIRDRCGTATLLGLLGLVPLVLASLGLAHFVRVAMLECVLFLVRFVLL